MGCIFAVSHFKKIDDINRTVSRNILRNTHSYDGFVQQHADRSVECSMHTGRGLRACLPDMDGISSDTNGPTKGEPAQRARKEMVADTYTCKSICHLQNLAWTVYPNDFRTS